MSNKTRSFIASGVLLVVVITITATTLIFARNSSEVQISAAELNRAALDSTNAIQPRLSAGEGLVVEYDSFTLGSAVSPA